jgi:hypothetical protein
MEPPVREATYTYVGDIDILFGESVLQPDRFKQMEHFDLPYSNIVRPNTTRLSGLMLVKSEEFYTTALRKEQARIGKYDRVNDEIYLYHLVRNAGLGTPPSSDQATQDKWTTYRPGHGIHLSSNRGPGKRMCLNVRGKSWYRFLNVSHLHNFLCLDNAAGLELLSRFTTTSQVEETQNMTHAKGSGCH